MAERGEPSIWTVGHGRRSLDELAGVLAAHAIDEVTDIRRFPGSRHNPQFARERLMVDLPATGIGYRWSGDALGGRRRLDPAAPPQQVWREASFRAFAQHSGSAELGEPLPHERQCLGRPWIFGWRDGENLVWSWGVQAGMMATSNARAQRTPASLVAAEVPAITETPQTRSAKFPS